MSSHYIDLICPAPDCTRSEGIYTGSVLTDYFEVALDYEGATIDARCDEHSTWEAPVTEEPSLNHLPEETLIRATGTYPGGGTFTDCWARPVPQYVSGAIDGSDRLWEVLVFGSGGVDALTTSACITSFEVLYTEASR